MRESRTYGSVRGACDETHVPTATPSRVRRGFGEVSRLTETIDCRIPAKTAGKPLCAEDAIELLEAMWVGASRSRHCRLSAHRWTQ